MRVIRIGYSPAAFAEAVAWDDGKRKQTAGACRHAPASSRGFRKEAFEGGRGRGRSDRQRSLGRSGDRAACKAGCGRKPKSRCASSLNAKIKTDTIDASVLAQLYVSGFLPEVWIPDEPTQALRRQVTRRNQIVRQRSRLKNIIQSILHSHLILLLPARRSVRGERTGMAFFTRSCRRTNALPKSNGICASSIGSAMTSRSSSVTCCPFGVRGRGRQTPDEQSQGSTWWWRSPSWPRSATWDAFEQSQKLVSYLGLNPSVRQSGPGPAYHGRITKQGPWACARHARRRRLGRQRERRVRCVRSSCESRARTRSACRQAVATARKLAVLIWHFAEQRAKATCGARPALHARKLPRSGAEGGIQGRARPKEAWPTRTISRAIAIRSADGSKQAETAYARFVSGWNPRGPKRVRTGCAATEVRR